jgi:thymidylate kinase
MIALSGPDGVGKSTVIAVLQNRSPRRTSLGVAVFHSRPFLFPRLAVLLPKKKREKVLETRGYESNLTPLKSWLRAVILVLDCQLGYWLKVRPKLARGHLVIFDRYVIDIRVDPRLRGYDLPDSVLRVLARLVPQPVLSVVIVATPETIVTRKKELSHREAKQQVDAYVSLAAEGGRTLLVRNDGLTATEVAAQIAERLSDMRRSERLSP